eukprot:13997030-Alexandrium_andersonii.AAC.2
MPFEDSFAWNARAASYSRKLLNLSGNVSLRNSPYSRSQPWSLGTRLRSVARSDQAATMSGTWRQQGFTFPVARKSTTT